MLTIVREQYPDLPINNQTFSPDIQDQLQAISLCQKIARSRDDIDPADVRKAADLLKKLGTNSVAASIIKEKTRIDSIIFQTGDLEFIKRVKQKYQYLIFLLLDFLA